MADASTDTITPGETFTFTVKTTPKRTAEIKTIRRLMRMQPEVQRGLSKLSTHRRRHVNETVIRAGVEWVIRPRTTKLTHVAPGATFTLRVIPHILPDIASVREYLDVSPA